MLEGALLNNRYRVQSLIGEGGMARVYRAEDSVLGRTVAVKVLREHLARDQGLLARFRDEARAAASLTHPNIVAIYDVGVQDDLHYIVMEYVDGPTLKDLISTSAPLPINRAVALALQILSALDLAHRRGIVHRDVKPQNVLLTADGQAKVTDFGIARQIAAASLTQTGEVFGTAYYLAPERANGQNATAASDVYSVGVMLYEMLSGRLPFTGDSPIEVALKHIQQLPPSLQAANPSVPPALQAVVFRALAKDPSQRFASAGAMAQALQDYDRSSAATTAALSVVGRQAPAAAPAAAAVARQAPPARKADARGFNWLLFLLLMATVMLLALLVPMGRLFYDAYLRPLLPAGIGVVDTATPTVTPTVMTATPTPTGTATPVPSPTVTPQPTVTPTPQYPAWMRFIVADDVRREVIEDKKQQLSEVRGEIRDQNGNLVPGLRVKIESEGGWTAERPRPGIDQADGTYRFDQLSPGRYKVTIIDENGQPISQTATDLVTDDLPWNFKGYTIWIVNFKQVQ